MRRGLRPAAMLLLGALGGCSSCRTSPTDACPGTCKPHPFCGKSCTSNTQCGEGTVCRTDGGSGTCGPPCTGCELGCAIIDHFACVAICRWPECCGQPCSSNADCCNGTVCGRTGSGERACVPKGCEQCPQGCEIVDRDRCGARCFEPDAGDGGTDGGVSEDAGEPFDAGESDAGFRPDGGVQDAGGADAGTVGPACKGCCERCLEGEGDCCDEFACLSLDGGQPVCVPAYCQECPYGCEVECP